MTRLSHFKLGLFVVACAAVGAVAVIWLGAARVFQGSRTYAAFFAEPVTGLAAGAPVKHLGVDVGRVHSVDLTPGDRLVQVLVDLDSGFRVDPSLALSLSQAGLTGSPFLALDEAPAGERRELPHPGTRHPVLPTRPGGGGIGGAMQGIEKKLTSLDIQGLLAAWEGVAREVERILTQGGVEQIVADARVASTGVARIAGPGAQGQPSQLELVVRDLQAATRSLRVATASITKQVEAVRPGTAVIVADRIERTTELGEKTVRSLDQNLDGSLVLLRENLAQLKQALAEAQALARSLRAEPGRVLERGGGSDPFSR